jgi:hypothetical protein
LSHDSLTETTVQPRSRELADDPERALGALAGDPVERPDDQYLEFARVRVIERPDRSGRQDPLGAPCAEELTTG